MLNKILQIILLILLAIAGNAQVENLTRLSDNEQNTELVIKGRQILLDKIISKEFADLPKLVNYIHALDSLTTYRSILPLEYMSVHMLATSFQSVLDMTQEEKMQHAHAWVTPQSFLFLKTREILKEKKDSIIQNIKKSNLDEMETDFLVLILNVITESSTIVSPNKSLSSDMFTDYIKKYPDNPYTKTIKKRLTKKAPSKNMFSFFMGYNRGFLTGNITDNFSNCGAMNYIFEFKHDKILFSIDGSIDLLKQKNDLVIDQYTWDKDSTFNRGMFNFLVGYNIHQNQHIMSYTKLGGVVGEFYNAHYPNGHDETVKIPNSTIGGITAGLGIDYTPFKPVVTSRIYDRKECFQLRIRFQYFYSYYFLNNIDQFKGGVHTISINLGFSIFYR